jgi:hypothetical protein
MPSITPSWHAKHHERGLIHRVRIENGLIPELHTKYLHETEAGLISRSTYGSGHQSSFSE